MKKLGESRRVTISLPEGIVPNAVQRCFALPALDGKFPLLRGCVPEEPGGPPAIGYKGETPHRPEGKPPRTTRCQRQASSNSLPENPIKLFVAPRRFHPVVVHCGGPGAVRL